MGQGSSTGRDGLLKREQVAFNEKTTAIPVGSLPQRRKHAPPAEASGEPEVRVVKAADGTVEQVIVRCTCGREITLQCEYLGHGDHNAKQGA